MPMTAAADAPAPPLRLYLLQRPRLVDPQGRELDLPPKDAALLALLVRERQASRQRLAQLLWPAGEDSDDATALARALNNLRQRLFRIGRWAGREVVSLQPAPQLAPDIEHDLQLGLGSLLAGEPAVAGDLLGSLVYDADTELGRWVAAARQAWRSQRAEALMVAIGQLEAQSRVADGLRLAQRLVAEEPLMEQASRALMRLQYRQGDRAAALSEFARVREALYQAHGDPPSDDTVALSQAIARSETAAPAQPPSLPLALRHPPRTIGRAADLQRADHRWLSGGQVLLLGAAGIGKSRVATELARRWGVAIEISCRPAALASGFALLSQLAQALPAGLQQRLEGADSEWWRWLASPAATPAPMQPVPISALIRAWAAAWRAAGELGLPGVVIEDLHFADAASLQVLCGLWRQGGQAAGTAPGWLLTARDNELPEEIRSWLDACEPGHDPVVRLQPLQAAATAEFVGSLGLSAAQSQAAVRLHEHCGGHPLFMLQVLRQLHLNGQLDAGAWPQALPLPEDAMASATHRLLRADPLAQQLAFLAALCAADFSATLACRLMNIPATQLLAPWRQLEDLHIFGSQGFAHDLIREAVRAAVPKPLAPLLHREIALALAAAGTDPLRLAHHWDAADEPAQAASQYLLAAQRARQAGLQQQALQALQRAAEGFERSGQAEAAFEARCQQATLLLQAESATPALALARRLAAQACTPRQHAQAGEQLARVLAQQHDTEALTHAEHALAQAELSGDAALVLRCRCALGAALSLWGRHEEALNAYESVAAQAALLDDEMRETFPYEHASALAAVGRRREAVAIQLADFEANLQQRRLVRASWAASFCAVHYGYLGRMPESIPLLHQSIELARRAGLDRGLTLVDEMTLAGNLGDLGRFDEALALSERLVEELASAGLASWAINAANDRAVIFMRLGRVDLAYKLLQDPAEDAPLWARAARCFVRAKLAQWQGLPSRELLALARSMFDDSGAVLSLHVRKKIELEVARADGPEAAAALAPEIADWAAGQDHVAMSRFALMVQMQALLELGRGAAAAELAWPLLQIDGLEDQAAGYYSPELMLTLARAAEHDAGPSAVEQMMQRAIRWVSRCAAGSVPAAYRESFLGRNPVNQSVLAWRARARY